MKRSPESPDLLALTMVGLSASAADEEAQSVALTTDGDGAAEAPPSMDSPRGTSIAGTAEDKATPEGQTAPEAASPAESPGSSTSITPTSVERSVGEATLPLAIEMSVFADIPRSGYTNSFRCGSETAAILQDRGNRAYQEDRGRAFQLPALRRIPAKHMPLITSQFRRALRDQCEFWQSRAPDDPIWKGNHRQGCTFTGGMVVPVVDEAGVESQRIVVGNLGDSVTFLIEQDESTGLFSGRCLTREHSLHRIVERGYVEAHGGSCYYDRGEWRALSLDGMRGLNMSGSIADPHFGSTLRRTADIYEYSVPAGKKAWVIFASDGLPSGTVRYLTDDMIRLCLAHIVEIFNRHHNPADPTAISWYVIQAIHQLFQEVTAQVMAATEEDPAHIDNLTVVMLPVHVPYTVGGLVTDGHGGAVVADHVAREFPEALVQGLNEVLDLIARNGLDSTPPSLGIARVSTATGGGGGGSAFSAPHDSRTPPARTPATLVPAGAAGAGSEARSPTGIDDGESGSPRPPTPIEEERDMTGYVPSLRALEEEPDEAIGTTGLSVSP